MTNQKKPTVRKEAALLARELGDEEWKQGNTKYALEAWEASDIAAGELLELARKLLKAAEITVDANRDVENAFKLPAKVQRYSTHHVAFQKDCSENGCVRCITHFAIVENYEQTIRELLGFDKSVANRFLGKGADKSIYRAAAVACLKLIKRMSAAR